MPHVSSSNSSGTGVLPPTSPLPKDEAEDAPAFNDMLMAGVITLQDKPFRVAIIGAGGINFGTPEGPWNHSIRLEHKLGPRLLVTALIDPNAKTRAAVLQAKRDSFVRSAYIDTKEYNTLEEYLDDLPNHIAPNAVLVGSPPAFHGSLKKNCNAEILCAERIPGVALFVEKPISASPVGDVMDILSLLDKKKIIVSVGYMMRSLKVVHKAKEILASQQLKVTATTARYFCTYPKIMKSDWWNKQICCGPIVEQATHFCDLSRFLAGDIEMGSIQAHALEHWEEAGQLNSVPIDESKIPAEDRIPRMTSAIWKYKDGGVGSLTHGITLHGTAYSTNLEVFADGYQLRLVDLYNKPSLHVRSPETDGEQIFTFPEDDPYQTQLNAFIAAIEEAEANPGNESLQDKVDSEILSTYADAVKTYAFTWAIRLASENKNKKLSQVVDLVNAIAIEE